MAFPQDELCPFFFSDFDITENFVELRFVDHGSYICFFSESVTQSKAGGRSFKSLNKGIIDSLMNTDSARGSASLSTRTKASPDSPLDRQIRIGIVHDNDDILSSHFSNDLTLDWAADLPKALSHIEGTCERDRVHPRVTDQVFSYLGARPMDEIQDPAG